MTRRKTLHAAALLLLIVVTVPVFALLCRGHSPSRFATSNLPFWERTVPRPARPRVALRCRPLPPGDVQFTDGRLRGRVLNADFNALFSPLEHPAAKRPDPVGGGKAGEWLVAACAMGRHETALRQAQDAAAMRLMNLQDGDGYLAAGVGRGRWSRAQIRACALNLRGLLSYYAVTHSPAAVYAAMRAGDLVVAEFSDAASDPNGAGGLVLPLTLLYQTTGETRYRRWAADRAEAGTADGTGLCALYAATGETGYLRQAQRDWKRTVAHRRSDVDLAAALWTLTGGPGYADAALRPGAAPWPCPTVPGGVTACARIPGGLAVAVPADARISFGAVRLTGRVNTDPRHGKGPTTTFAIQTPRPCVFTLRLPTSSSTASPTLLNGAALPSAVCGRPFLTLTRRWKSGDTLTLPSATTPAAVPSHAALSRITVR